MSTSFYPDRYLRQSVRRDIPYEEYTALNIDDSVYSIYIFIKQHRQDPRNDSQSGNLPENVKVPVVKGKLGIKDIKYSPNGTHIAVASRIGILLYDTRIYDKSELLTGHKGQIWSVAFSPDGKTLASGGQDESIRLWDVNTRRQIRKITRRSVSVAFSPDGKTLASASGNIVRTIDLLDVHTGKHLRTLTGTDKGKARGLAFSPNGKMLALYGSGYHGHHTIRLWDVNTGQQLRTVIHEVDGFGLGVTDVAFSPDSSTIASVGHHTIRLWDVNNGQQIRAITEMAEAVIDFWSVAFSADGRTIVGANSSGIVQWNVNTGKHIRTIAGRGYVGRLVAFSPDGKTIASGGHEEAFLWNVETGQLIKTLISRF